MPPILTLWELTEEECRTDPNCGPALREFEANPDTAKIEPMLLDPPDSMESVTTWDHLTRGDCWQIDACREAFNHHYRRPDIFPEVVLGSPDDIRTTAEVIADTKALEAAQAAELEKLFTWDGIKTMILESPDIHNWLLIFAAIIAVAAIYYLILKPMDDKAAARRKEQWELYGSSKWLDIEKAKKNNLYGTAAQGILLGHYGKNDDPIRYPGKAHLLTFAPTGSGKGVSAIIPNLLEYPGSILCIDPKGENAAVTARCRRAMGQQVHLLDPFKVVADDPASFNPLDWLDVQSENFNADCMMLADALVVSGRFGPDHWDREAKAMIAGLLMFIAAHETPERRNMLRLYDLISGSAEQIQKMIRAMQGSSLPSIVKAGNRMDQKLSQSEREFASVMSSAQSHLHFLDTPQMERVLSSTSFDPMKLKSGNMTVFLILPPDQLNNMSSWLRLMVTMTIASFSRDKTVPEHQTLFLLDEFAALGTLQAVKTAMGLMRGYGVKMWPILQDLSQLQSLYPDMWESFIANAGVSQIFGTNDPRTAEYFAKKAGVTTVGEDRDTPGGGTTVTKKGRLLIMPDEILRLDNGQLLFVQNMEPMRCAKRAYWEIKEFNGKWDENPYY